jgi:hypothetical protein
MAVGWGGPSMREIIAVGPTRLASLADLPPTGEVYRVCLSIIAGPTPPQ